jgi:hypothetical protein
VEKGGRGGEKKTTFWSISENVSKRKERDRERSLKMCGNVEIVEEREREGERESVRRRDG